MVSKPWVEGLVVLRTRLPLMHLRLLTSESIKESVDMDSEDTDIESMSKLMRSKKQDVGQGMVMSMVKHSCSRKLGEGVFIDKKATNDLINDVIERAASEHFEKIAERVIAKNEPVMSKERVSDIRVIYKGIVMINPHIRNG